MELVELTAALFLSPSIGCRNSLLQLFWLQRLHTAPFLKRGHIHKWSYIRPLSSSLKGHGLVVRQDLFMLYIRKSVMELANTRVSIRSPLLSTVRVTQMQLVEYACTSAFCCLSALSCSIYHSPSSVRMPLRDKQGKLRTDIRASSSDESKAWSTCSNAQRTKKEKDLQKSKTASIEHYTRESGQNTHH